MAKANKSLTPSTEKMKFSYNEARKVGDRLEEARWANSIGNLLKERGEYVKALKWYRRDYDISQKLADDTKSCLNLMTTCQCMGEINFRLKDYKEAHFFMVQHYDLATKVSDQVEQQRSSTQLGRLFLDRSGLDEDDHSGLPFGTSALPVAKEHVERALEIAQTLKDNPPVLHSRSFVVELVDAHNNVGLLREEEDDADGALRHFRQALDIGLQEELADTAELSRVHHNLGRIYMAHRDWNKALRHTKKDIEICGKIGHKQGEAKGHINLGEIHTRQLQFEESMRSYKKALELAKELADEFELRATIKDNISVVKGLLQAKSEFDSKRQEQKRLERGVADAKDPASKRLALKQEFSKLKELLELAGATTLKAWDDHLQLSLRLKEVCEQLGDLEKEGDALGELAESYENLRDFKKARKWYEASYKICERLGHLEGQAVAKLNCGNALDKMGLYEQAVDAYETAYEIAKQQDDENYLRLQEQALDNLHLSFLIRLKHLDKAREVESRLKELRLCQKSLLDSEEGPLMYPRSRSRRKLSRQSSGLEKPSQQQGLHDVPDSESDGCEVEVSVNMYISESDQSLARKQPALERNQQPVVNKECSEAEAQNRPTRRLLRRSGQLHRTDCSRGTESKQCTPGLGDGEDELPATECAQSLSSSPHRTGTNENQTHFTHQPTLLHENLLTSVPSSKRRRLCGREEAPFGNGEQLDVVADSDDDDSDSDGTRFKHGKTTRRQHSKMQLDEVQPQADLKEFPDRHLHSCSMQQSYGASSSLEKLNDTDAEEQEVQHVVALTGSGQPVERDTHGNSGMKTGPASCEVGVMRQAEPQRKTMDGGVSTSVTLLDTYSVQCHKMCCTLNSSVAERLAGARGSNDELNVSDCNLDDANARPFLAALEAHEPVCALDMSHNMLGNETMHSIQKLISKTSDKDPGLTLDLHNNRLGAGCLTHMCQCTVTLARLEVLDLSGNRLTDAVARHLCVLLEHCSTLATLQLRACGLTTRTIKRVTAALKPTCSLSKLAIGGNNPIAGFAISELLQKLATLNSFSELDLGQVDIDATGVQSITSFLSSSRSISILLLQETGIQNDGADMITSFLKRNPCSLMKLDLSSCRIYGHPATSLCEQVINIQGLSWLDLSENHLDPRAAEAIGRGLERAGCRLKRLKLRNCSLGMQGLLQVIRSLKGNLTLHYMNLAGNLIKPEKVLLATTGDDAPVGALKGNHHDTLPAVVSLPKLGDDQSFAGLRSGEDLTGYHSPRMQDMLQQVECCVQPITPQGTKAVVNNSEHLWGRNEPEPSDIADSEEDEKSEVETPLQGSQKRKLALRVRRRKSKESMPSAFCPPSSTLHLQLGEAIREARVLCVLDLSNNGLCQGEVNELFVTWCHSRQARSPKLDAHQGHGQVVFSTEGRAYPEPTCCGVHFNNA